MCILSFQQSENGLFLIANREEDFRRPLHGPFWCEDYTIAGPDYGMRGQHDKAGSWFGYNKYGLVVTLTNRDDGDHKNINESVGRLLVELLATKDNVDIALMHCVTELTTKNYRPVNFVIADLSLIHI